MENTKKKEVKVFVGGKESAQRRHFIPAKAGYVDKAEFDELTIEKLCRDEKYSIQEYLEWAFSGDVYMQIAHPLQENDLPWDYTEFQRLIVEYAEDFVSKGGKIFPPLPKQLGCNILNQNKFAYINSVPDMFIPSFKLERTENGLLDKATKAALWDFLASYYELHRDHYVGTFVFKSPYTTGSKGVAWPKTFTEVLDQFRSWCLNDKFGNMPYFFVQPKLANRQEYKVVIPANDYGIPLEPYVAVNHVNAPKRLAFSQDDEELIAFARRCVGRLINANPNNSVACAPLLRVDIMRLQNGEWLVNEFESIEALTDKADYTGEQENLTATYLRCFWKIDIARVLASD